MTAHALRVLPGVGVMLQEAKEESAGFVNLQEIAVDS